MTNINNSYIEEDEEYGQLRKRLKNDNSNGTNGKNHQSKNSKHNQFMVGSIRKIILKGFVTYDYCQFYPGPNLNMIIGPNGTGKSTIVCGIALGLGGSTSVLGRAKDVYDFVKHGYKEATIEVTLQDKNDYKITITRTIDKVKKCSIWTINNKISTQKQVLSTVKGLNIQVDNLCQFLPQDKVCEFAQMSPIELLQSTLKASGSTELSEDHQKLVLLRNEQKALIKTVEEDSTHVKSLEARNQSLKQEVERFKEREEYLRTIELYKLRIILTKYSKAKLLYDQSKIDRKKVQDKIANLNEKLLPLNKLKGQQERLIEKYTAETNKTESKASKYVVQINRYTNSIERIQSEIDEAKNQITQFTNDANDRKKQILKLKNEIEGLEHRLNEGIPQEVDMADIRAKIAKLRQQQISLEHQLQESKDSQKIVINETRDFKAKISDLQHQLRELDDVKKQKLLLLRNFHRDSYTALNWLANNQAVFTKIYQPIFLEVNLTDLNYADAIESVVGHQALRTFVCSTESDYHRVTGEIIDKQKLRIDVCCFNKTIADFKPPVPVEAIKKLGFDNYLINYIKAPEPVLVTLCVKANIHAIPVALKRVDHERISEMSWISVYVSERTRYVVKRSEYGMKSASVVTSRIPRARILIHSANTEKKSALEKNMTDLRERISENDQKINDKSQEDVKLNSQISEIESQKHEIEQQKLKLQKLQESYNRAHASLETKKSTLDSLNQESNDASVDKIKERMKQLCDKLGKAVLNAKNLPSEYTEIVLESWKQKLKVVEATSKLKTLEKAEDQFDRIQQKTREMLAKAQDSYERYKAEATTLMKEANSSIDSAPEDLKQELSNFRTNIPLPQLEEELIGVQAKLNLTLNANEGVIEAYEKRVQEIERLQEKITSNETELTRVTKAVQSLHSQWEPKITNLVSSISTNFTEAFQSIGCIGEVQLDQNEDYSRWGINILVKFRDHEKLQLLTGQRQSGGERSVSTIMYLLAIQELAASPFRVVDEINQGMDPKNERMVHKQLVNVACRPETAQYFLITPKLLTNLEYHSKMKVLCIYNGEWQPYDFDTKSYLSQLISQSQK